VGTGRQERIVAVTNLIRIEKTGSAEVAFLVKDKIQMRGIGTAFYWSGWPKLRTGTG